MNIALFSPSKNPYSETFIQAHKNYLKGNMFYFYGSGSDIRLEGVGELEASFYYDLLKVKGKLLGRKYGYAWEQVLLKALKKYKIDVVLVEYGNHAFYLKNVLNKLKIPIVVHFHGVDASSRYIIEYCNNYKTVFSFSSKVIAVSKLMVQNLFDLGCPMEKLVCNPCGPNSDFFNVKAKFSKKQFIGIGRFVDKKAPYYTILAFKEVLIKYPEAILLLAGKGLLLDTCINLVKSLNLEKNVSFLGVITPHEFQNYLSESLAYVQHSITASSGDKEGTPVAVLEASAAGLPVISTKHAGIPDVIIEGETGLLCNEHDVVKMTQNMLFLLDNPKKAILMGEQGRKNISEHFTLDRHISILQKIIDDLV
ncbi:glycosyltransferase [Winogradskyella sp. F6397]|uniref:Glycosyltransferase n=1 Tax=Winogradskyella marina TaxID=2785530 RepID=A0ABS0EKI7_9FLAO|nr:glycosyltransferase [Winogradskyella marina]MBF8150980.1 glycosyltransferase [Winogradskyella marina]